ncbi:MAG: ribonuclease HII [Candidatus Tokpelaia sp.]|uniref:ribonuclease HII n=1 Tax=Candidatus Tokpelaia sp. TaxID=2233777 RepID=UPI00123C06E9|nr:ribonuclease HII [Candidatus Tokpelaia sp.]KAA6204762.1 MAG: ribonuclease HII [Candidatus Tokpelaia sp.]KAA6206756.1 MAG: ribonuclease HII [Candidatus Tokpelaia sp.]KAA6405332.1 ribonuclease HII [Candidatus Tokpelaia sp.]
MPVATSDSAALAMKAAFIPAQPDFAAEALLRRQGARAVCGVDEVGRGPLAGPVVTAAVILDPDNLPQGVADSKKLSALQRAALAEEILAKALAVSIASLPARVIDAGNIRAAALAAMRMAVDGLALCPDYALIDGRDIPPRLRCRAFALIKGDARSLSVAAASIIAKNMRDKMMQRAESSYPGYGFGKHMGYGTAQHLAALTQMGAVPGLHRFSFAPLKILAKK